MEKAKKEKGEKKGTEKLQFWKERLAEAEGSWDEQRPKMQRRERLYRGEEMLRPIVKEDTDLAGKAWNGNYKYNIVFENVEAQVSTAIPYPKVTAVREEDQALARKIEQYLMNEIDRINMEEINDLSERVNIIQGGVGYLVEWDESRRRHFSAGENTVQVIHPMRFTPQPGVYSSPEDMDYFILRLSVTTGYIRRRYQKEVAQTQEEDSELRGENSGTAQDMMTQYKCYYRNKAGGVGLFSWCGDTVLEDMEDYQARRITRCAACGAIRPLEGEKVQDQGGKEVPYENGPCPSCGARRWEDGELEFQEILDGFETEAGVTVPGLELKMENGAGLWAPTRVPFYKPKLFPIVVQKSVSLYDQLLGNSDVDVIADQQNAVTRLDLKALKKVVKSGTKVTLPNKAAFEITGEEQDVWRLESPADKSMIDTYEFSGDVGTPMNLRGQIYKDAQNLLGITDSYLGRVDPTATSGKAKQFSAGQSAGRFQSKRVMKEAAFAAIYERMFKNFLAYADEPRTVRGKNSKGEPEYQMISRWDFLQVDEDTGNYWWNDNFLFSVDSATNLERNREAMWEETRINFQSGTFGDPATDEARGMFWTVMNKHHYPGAAEMREYFENRITEAKNKATIQALAANGPSIAGMVPGAGGMEPGAAGGMGGIAQEG